MASRTIAAPPRTRLPDPRVTGHWTARVPHYSSMVLAVYSALLVTWSVLPFLRGPMRIPREYVHTYFFGAPDTSLAWALALGLLAAALAARKRVAWWLLTGYMAVFAVVNVVQYLAGLGVHAVVAMGIHLLAVGALLLSRRQFSTRVRRAALWRALATLFGGWFLAVMVGWGLVELFPETLTEPRFWWAFWRVTAIGAATTSDRLLFDGHPAGWVNMLLGGFGMVVMLATVSALFRSQRDDNAITGIDESAIRYLLAESHPADSLGYFATRRDKAVVFSPNGQAAICYRVEAGICLASADPIGPQHAWDQAITAWRARCVQYGWEPAVIGAGQAAAAAYARAGLTVLHLGDEAVVTASTLRYLTSPTLKPVRQAVSRARRAGLTIRVRRHRDLTAKEMARTCQLAADWRDTDTERGFSMALGRMADPFDGECLLIEAVNEHGAVVGILSFVPWGATGASLDVMRRSPTAPGGVVEFMITEFAAVADGFGINKLSLNFAVMRSVFADGAQLGAGPVLRAWRALLILGSRWWQLETLYRSNAKYRPDWVPRYLCFDDARHLPRVSLAAGICEGFVNLPWRRSDGDGRLHTGTHPSVPPALLASGLLHTDGRAPDVPIQLPRPAVRRPEQVRVRMAKLSALSATGIDPYPLAQPPTHSIEEARRQPADTVVRIAGRILRLRDLGGVVFAVLRDFSGDLQVLVDSGQVGRERAREFARLDIGDLISAGGALGNSRSGEWSVLASEWRLNAKCLHPLPNKWKGLIDPETRVRQRYVDLAVNARARMLLRQRSAIVAALRDTLSGHEFLEVETPILQQVHGGANAAPFLTHINAYNLDLYLRIAPELYLKRLCVAGVDKVFEIGRVFRNEGVSFKHNPEFTILEAYAAHGDYQTMRKLSQELIQTAARAAHGREIIRRPGPDGQPVDIDISGDWPVKTFHSAVSEALGVTVGPDTPLARLRELCDAHGIAYQASWDAGAVLLEIYENLVEHHTEFPTFYIDFPLSVSPLTRPHPDNPGVAAKWDLVAWGVELGTAYSELTDPIDQRERLTQQSLLAAGGDPEAMELDEDFLRALEHGMPPTGGLGIGVDRVVMLITGCGIRESLPFPLARPHT